MKILVVEDERDVLDLISLHLRREGHTVIACENGEDGLARLKSENLESEKLRLVILDWMLPSVSGLEICKKIRTELKLDTPVLMVTARADSADIIAGLETGADDYITKPFEIPVFLARVKALVRRQEIQDGLKKESVGSPSGEPQNFRVGGLKVSVASHQAWCQKDEIQLTVSEFKLLCALLKNQGRVLSRDQLIAQVQGEGVTVIDRTVDTHVFGLRKKLGNCADVIETIRGVGYRINA